MNQSQLRDLFKQHRNRPAITSESGTLNYAQLEQHTQQALHWLQSKQLKAGDRVCIVAKNNSTWFQLFLAALYSGIQLAPANWRLPASELAPLLNELKPKLIIADDDCYALASESSQQDIIRLSTFTQQTSQLEPHWPQCQQPKATDTVQLLKTGGTTGRSRWAKQTHQQICLNAQHSQSVMGLTASDAVIQATPLFHAGCNVFATPLLLCGGHVIVRNDFEPTQYLKQAAQYHATVIFGVPTVFEMLLTSDLFNSQHLNSIKWVVSGGAPCPPGLAKQIGQRGFCLRQGFGMTEAGVNCFQLAEVANPNGLQNQPNAVGKAMPHLQMSLDNGELIIKGKGIFGGYLNDPTPEEVRTGDLFSQDQHGNFFVEGRAKEMYISGGENVFPVEVENRLGDHPALASVAITSISSAQWGETGLAACVLKANQTLTTTQLADSIKTFLKPLLAAYKIPTEVIILQQLPLTAAGKVNKRAIQQLWK